LEPKDKIDRRFSYKAKGLKKKEAWGNPFKWGNG
jgi:hypothetical protein